MTARLKFGLSACFFHPDPQRSIFKGKTLQYVEQSLAHWVMSEGAMLWMIPAVAEKNKITVHDQANELDGLVLSGGSDVCPKSYGATALKPEWNGDYIRDCYEIALVREFMAQKKPILGICRGAQLLNVALGGTLIQDIGTQVKTEINHRNWDIYDQNFHTLKFEPGTGLAKLYPGIKEARVNSVHHQALDKIGKDLIVEARAEGDGLPEAVRLKGDTYVFATQWHPEFHDAARTDILNSQPILREFMTAAMQRKG